MISSVCSPPEPGRGSSKEHGSTTCKVILSLSRTALLFACTAILRVYLYIPGTQYIVRIYSILVLYSTMQYVRNYEFPKSVEHASIFGKGKFYLGTSPPPQKASVWRRAWSAHSAFSEWSMVGVQSDIWIVDDRSGSGSLPSIAVRSRTRYIEIDSLATT